jgi:hypothetical protein
MVFFPVQVKGDCLIVAFFVIEFFNAAPPSVSVAYGSASAAANGKVKLKTAPPAELGWAHIFP